MHACMHACSNLHALSAFVPACEPVTPTQHIQSSAPAHVQAADVLSGFQAIPETCNNLP